VAKRNTPLSSVSDAWKITWPASLLIAPEVVVLIGAAE